MTDTDRKQAWENLSEPKPSWETFKRLLSIRSEPEAARLLWLEKTKKTS